jgi:hypothetical protein
MDEFWQGFIAGMLVAYACSILVMMLFLWDMRRRKWAGLALSHVRKRRPSIIGRRLYGVEAQPGQNPIGERSLPIVPRISVNVRARQGAPRL